MSKNSSAPVLIFFIGIVCITLGSFIGIYFKPKNLLQLIESNLYTLGLQEIPRASARVSFIRKEKPMDQKAIVTSPSVMWPQYVPILMYHYVEYVKDKGDTIRQSLDTLPITFEKQLETLSNGGYTFMTMRELGDVFDGKRRLPDKPLILTFDDGYGDFYTDAYPLLKKYNAKATVYVISGFIGYRNYMNEKEIQEIAKEGLVEIGDHTVHHISLKYAPNEEIQKELAESKTKLESLIGMPVFSFAYPNGSYDDRSEIFVKQAGFSTAAGTKLGVLLDPSMRYKLTRIRPGANTGTDLLKRLSLNSF